MPVVAEAVLTRQHAQVGWRRRTAWERRDWIALGVLAGSIALGVFLASTDVLRVGVRQGLGFLLIFVVLAAAMVPLVRHAPLPVLQYAQPVAFLLGGPILAIISSGPLRCIAIAATALGVIQLILQLRQRSRTRRRPDLGAPEDDIE